MKLHELDALNKQDKVERVLESRLGYAVDFNKLNLRESQGMLQRVRGLINEHRSSADFHSSERDPSYLKLVMLEQGLSSHAKTLKQKKIKETEQVMMPVDPKDPKLQQTLKKAQTGQNLTPDEQKTVSAIATQSVQKESRRARRKLKESDLQSAQVVLAAQDMIDQIQKMLEQISEMQFKDLPALTDSIKNDMGVDQATAYQSAAAAALTQLLQSVQQGKTALESAQGTLTGQAPTVPGEEPAADMGAELPPEGGDELNPDLGGDELNPDLGDEEDLGAAPDLGRDRRGVAEAKKGAKPDFLDMDKDGDKKEPMKKAVADKKKNPFAKKGK